jgi:5-bromo-4-chloroindolyl phosphate hydrolysis protein
MTFDLKKALLSLGVAVVVFFLLYFVVKAIISVFILDIMFAVVAGLAVYQFVAWWEVKKLYEEAKTKLGL